MGFFPRKSPSRILVVRTDRIGDAVMTTPLLRALREKFPDAHIASLVHPRARDVLLHNPHINELLTDDPEREHNGRKGFWRQVRALRERKFDTALLLLPTERLAWMLFAAGIPRRYSVGVKLYGVLTGMRSVRRRFIPLRHEADYCLDFGRTLGVTSANLAPEVFISPDESAEARRLLMSRGLQLNSEEEVLVGIHPGSGRSAPNWRIDRYVELCESLIRNPKVRVILLGANDGTGSATRFDHLPASRVVNLIDAISLRRAIAVIGLLRVFVSSSTGPMHLAAALRIPTVSMFCPMPDPSPAHWGPLGNEASIVLPSEGYCTLRCPGDPHVCDFEGGILPKSVEIAILHAVGLAGAGHAIA